MKLRPYQTEAVQNVIDAWRDHKSTLGVAATGLGKTRIIAGILEHPDRPKGRMMFLAHRKKLIYQAALHIRKVTGLETDIEMGEMRASHHFGRVAPVVVSSIQTQISGTGSRRMERFDPEEFGIIVVDEAHHAVSGSYRAIIEHYRQHSGAHLIGVTATPDRADEKALGQVFESVAFDFDIRYGIDEGWLCPVRQFMVNVSGLDLSGVHVTAGDLNGAELGKVMEDERVELEIAKASLDECGERKTLVFAATVVQAQRLCDILNRYKNNSARFVYAKTPDDERAGMYQDYAVGRFQYLVNVGVATEGFDEPGVEVVVMARPTTSRSLYAQMAGRSTRPIIPLELNRLPEADTRRDAIATSPKPYCEILDFVGNSGKHKLVTTADILGGNYEEAVIELASRTAREEAYAGALAQDTSIALERAARKLAEQREAERRRILTPTASYRKQTVDPFDLFQITPWREKLWDSDRKPSAKMVTILEKFMLRKNPRSPAQERENEETRKVIAALTFTQARQMITQFFQRAKDKRCTYRQAQMLAKYGYDTDMSFTEAGQVIDDLAKHGWKRREPTLATELDGVEV